MSGVLGDRGNADAGGGGIDAEKAVSKLDVCKVGSIGGGML
jgi:hypothetical protein